MRKWLTTTTLAILFAFVVSSAYAQWTISPEWTLGPEWSYIGDPTPDTYVITLVITNPTNISYGTPNVPVALSIGGNDTNPTYNWNFQYSNGTWLYATNHTSASDALTFAGNATGNFSCGVVGLRGSTDYKEVGLTVNFTVTETYTIDLVISEPSGAVHVGQNVTVALSKTGNETVTAASYTWNVHDSLGAWLLPVNQTGATGTFLLDGNDTYTFCGRVTGNHLATDYDEVPFLGYYTYVAPLPEPVTGEQGNTAGWDAMPVVLLGVMVAVVGLGFVIKIRSD